MLAAYNLNLISRTQDRRRKLILQVVSDSHVYHEPAFIHKIIMNKYINKDNNREYACNSSNGEAETRGSAFKPT